MFKKTMSSYRRRLHAVGFTLILSAGLAILCGPSSLNLEAFFPAAAPLANAHVFPVPFVPSKGDSRITFTDLENSSTIRIYSISGQLVQTLEESDGDGQYVWDGKSSEGDDLASGIYLYDIRSASAEKSGKLVIVR